MRSLTPRFTWRIVMLVLALAGGLAFGGGLHLVTHAAAPRAAVVPVRSSRAPNLPSQPGDVFAGVGHGMIDHFQSSGALIETLDTTSLSSEDTGMCIDNAGTLYATNWTAGSMATFNALGNRSAFPWAGPFSFHPETCVVDGAGNIYVGEVDGSNLIRKFTPGGALLGTWAPSAGSRGVDWMDLAADQCTMFYTSEGSTVKRYDVCASVQRPDFAIGLTGPAYALRIRGNGEVMVATQTGLVRLDPNGAIMQLYPVANYPGTSFLFAANLDPDGTSIWTGDYHTGLIYKIDIASGAALLHFTAPPQGLSMGGLAVFGELTQALPSATPGTPVTMTPIPTATTQPLQPSATPQPPQPTETVAVESSPTQSPTLVQTPTDVPRATRTPNPTQTPRATATPPRTSVPGASATPVPTGVPAASATPRPKGTNTPVPTRTPRGLAPGAPSNSDNPLDALLASKPAESAQNSSIAAFTDLGPNNPFYAAVGDLRAKGVIAGYPDGTFRPYAPTTRGQVAKIVALAFGYALPAGQSANPAFTDVPATQPFYPYIAALQARQIVSGHADGTFRPDAPITRGELAKILVQAQHWAISTPAGPSFTDVPGNSPFFVYIETAYAHHALSGYGSSFHPNDKATRGQVSKVVASAIDGADQPVQQP